MKVGTDANILSVWCDVNGVKSALDIGTGSGVISMVIASRCNAGIDAIEIDKTSCDEAGNNFRNSPYADRLKIIHGDFKDFSNSSENKYDLVISNPPFFTNYPLSTKKENRNKARHTIHLSHDQLIKGAIKVMHPTGRLCIVIPYDIHHKLVNKAKELDLFIHRQLLIHPRHNTEPNRINMEFRFGKPNNLISEDFIVRTPEGFFTDQYKDFFKDHLTDFLF